MAEIGNELPVQNPGVNIPGLANARARNQEQEEQNRVDENRQEQNRLNEQPPAQDAEDTPNALNAQDLPTDRVTVAGPADARANPGQAEQRVLRANGELVIVPPQDIPENPPVDEPQGFDLGQPAADLNQPPAEFQASGPGGLNETPGGPADLNVGGINDQIQERAAAATPSLDQIQEQQRAGRPEPVERQAPQDRPAQGLAEEVDDGRGPGLEAQAPDNPIFETPSQDVRNLTLDRAGVSTTSTGRANADDVNIRENIRDNIDAQRARQNQENEQREPERAQTQRGQNVDRLI